MKHSNENTNAFLIHISAFLGYIFPLGSIITPLILWQTQKDKSEFLNSHGKEAVNFNISYGLYQLVLGVGILGIFFGNLYNISNGNFNFDVNIESPLEISGVIVIASIASTIGLLLILIKFILILIAGIKANNGESYAYPFTIKFIK